MKGGTGTSCASVRGRGRSKGDAGEVVNENGVGAVGGGRCMNVRFSSASDFTTASGLLTRGSGARYGGVSARRFVARCRVA